MNNAVSRSQNTDSKKGYKPDLNELQSQCEMNYLLLGRLIPEFLEKPSQRENAFSEKQKWHFESPSVSLKFKLIESTRYTTTLNIQVNAPSEVLDPIEEIVLRLYHDAQMAEVMEGSGPGTLKAVYRQTKRQHRPLDEKRQANRFVAECLRACSTKEALLDAS